MGSKLVDDGTIIRLAGRHTALPEAHYKCDPYGSLALGVTMTETNKAERKRVEPRDVRLATRQPNGVTRTSLRVHLTRSERALLEAKARNYGWSLSRTLVHSALHSVQAEEIDTNNLEEVIADLRDYRRKLTGLANNVNQLTRYAHGKQELSEYMSDVLAHIEHSVDEINYLLASVRR